MNTKKLVLAACAALALGGMTTADASAQQCRVRGGNTGYNTGGYGYNTGYSGQYGNNYNVGNNFNRRSKQGYGYNSGYGASLRYNGYSNNRSTLSLGLGYNSGYRNSGYNAGYGNLNTRSGLGAGYYGNNSRQPVAYRHGDHIDVEDGNGRYHVTGRGGY